MAQASNFQGPGPSVQPGSSREKKITRGSLEQGKEGGGKGGLGRTDL